jgi:hypothetical protein
MQSQTTFAFDVEVPRTLFKIVVYRTGGQSMTGCHQKLERLWTLRLHGTTQATNNRFVKDVKIWTCWNFLIRTRLGITQDQLGNAVKERGKFIRNLGKIGTVIFQKDCQVCQCLFAIIPYPSSADQEILLLPDWTVCRISGETGIELHSDEQRKYGTCLIVALDPNPFVSVPHPIQAHRSDALCLLQNDQEEQRTLGGRKIVPDEPDFSIINEWLDRCAHQHDTSCKPLFTNELHNVHLIDVESRTIVNHPGHECDDVALSYVWGGVEQRRYKLGERVMELPRTLEDSIIFTKKLGKRYLWVDSVCIDQGNHTEKEDQIQRMRSVYRGAYITVIAISGPSANSGLPKMSYKEVYQQATCCINGKRLVGVMPTLSQQVWVTPWGQRGWTFQEARLSPRCLFLSDHQIYFECKAIQWLESLDFRQSRVHNLSVASNPTTGGFETWMMEQSGSGCFRHSIDSHDRRLANYGFCVNMYTKRSLMYAEDALNAFTGLLQAFTDMYPKGFIQGLPIEDLGWAMLWRSYGPSKRRVEFSSWTWAGWEGGVWHGQPQDHTKPRRFPVPLDISVVSKSQFQSIFHTNPTEDVRRTGICFEIRNDPVEKAARQSLGDSAFSIDYPAAVQAKILVIDAVCFQLVLDFSKPLHRSREIGAYGFFKISVGKKTCYIKILSTDSEISKYQYSKKTFILIARDHFDGLISHYLLLIYSGDHEGIVERGTALELLIPLDELDILEELKPTRRRIVLM